MKNPRVIVALFALIALFVIWMTACPLKPPPDVDPPIVYPVTVELEEATTINPTSWTVLPEYIESTVGENGLRCKDNPPIDLTTTFEIPTSGMHNISIVMWGKSPQEDAFCAWIDDQELTKLYPPTPQVWGEWVTVKRSLELASGTHTLKVARYEQNVRVDKMVVFPVADVDTDANLTWEAPTTNEDGTPLTDLSHYTIYWATTPDLYEKLIDTTEVDVTIEGLDPQTAYYFMVTASDESGNESQPSNVATWGE